LHAHALRRQNTENERGNHDVILSLNVLPNGEHIGQLQKRVSIKLNNHAFNGEKIQEFQLTENKWAQVYISGNYFMKYYG